MFRTSQHMTTLATRSTCVLSRTWELERMAWQRTQTALPGTQNELPYLVKCINNYFFVSQIFYAFFCVTKYKPIFLYPLLPFIFLKTDTYPTCSSLSPFRHPHTHHIFPPNACTVFHSILLPLRTHTHTPAVPTSTVDTEAATICSLTQTLTLLPQWVRITKLPRPMAQWEVTPPLLGWEGQLLTWEETEIELEDARHITLTGANWFVITF